MPFLSVIIPVYNAEKYLKICFESIMKQTFEDYEVIIIDDGSRDQSPQICDEYAQLDQRVKVIHVENGGASQARNIGFQKAIGRYIYCIDNDDCIETVDYFKKIHDSLLDNPVDVLQTGATYINENSYKIKRKVDYQSAPKINVDNPYETIYWLMSNKLYETSCWTKIISRQFLLSNRLFFDTKLVVEDLDWNMRFFQKIKTYNLLKSSDYIHIYRGGSITSGQDEKGYKLCLDQIRTIQKWTSFYECYRKNQILKEAALSYMSYQYFITIGKSSTLDTKWRKLLKEPLKDIGFVSKYSIEKKQKLVSLIYKIFGFEFTSKILNVYYTHMRTRARLGKKR